MAEKYGNLEDKIPSVWNTYEAAGVALSWDIVFLFDIKDPELIRVISLIRLNTKTLDLTNHIDSKFSFAGLYPTKQKAYNIIPDKLKK